MGVVSWAAWPVCHKKIGKYVSTFLLADDLLVVEDHSRARLLPVILSPVIRTIICDRPRQNQPYCVGYQSEIQAHLVAQGDNYHFSLFGIDR